MRWYGRFRVFAYPRNEICRTIFVKGCYEPNEFFVLKKVLRTGMTVMDVGANIGLYSIFASRLVGSHGKIIAIEPSQREFGRLTDNLTLNSAHNVCAMRVACSNYSGEADIVIAADGKEGHNTLGSLSYASAKVKEVQRVRIERLDDLVEREEVARVDVLKLDIEGAELFALLGAAKILEHFRPIILIELSDRTLERQGCSTFQIWDLLVSYGYTLFTIDDRTGSLIRAEQQQHYDSKNIVAVHRAAEMTRSCQT